MHRRREEGGQSSFALHDDVAHQEATLPERLLARRRWEARRRPGSAVMACLSNPFMKRLLLLFILLLLILVLLVHVGGRQRYPHSLDSKFMTPLTVPLSVPTESTLAQADKAIILHTSATTTTPSSNQAVNVSTGRQPTENISLNHTVAEAPLAGEEDFSLPSVEQHMKVEDRPHGSNSSQVHYHIVFSTECTSYHHWQSYLLFHQIMSVGQPGSVTRIVSGCSPSGQVQCQALFDQQIRPMMTTHHRFHIHFTPNYSRIHRKEPYVYFNKPFGMQHWMQQALGYPDHHRQKDDNDTIIILMDPDQLLIRPFVDNNFMHHQWRFLSASEKPRLQIRPGEPMGQLYGFSLQWKHKINMTRLLPENATSPVLNMSDQEARRGYIVGPPYMAMARDMYRIVAQWCDFVIPVHEQYPHLLAEMFAYSLAAAHLRLSHQTAVSFMVSNVRTPWNEGWSFLMQEPTPTPVCLTPLPQSPRLPHVIHYCQAYALGPYSFYKGNVPKEIFSCTRPMLEEPPVDLALLYNGTEGAWGQYHTYSPSQRQGQAFMLCQLIAAVNAAAAYFKTTQCDAATANMNKVLRLYPY